MPEKVAKMIGFGARGVPNGAKHGPIGAIVRDAVWMMMCVCVMCMVFGNVGYDFGRMP